MPGPQKVRGKVHVVLNRLVRDGLTSALKTNFDDREGAAVPRVTVAAPEG